MRITICDLKMDESFHPMLVKDGVFPWSYAIKTFENRWCRFINTVSFQEIEHITL